MAALILESRSTTCSSRRSLFLASRRSVAITCATELFSSGTRSRMSRIVCWRISSGSSVFSTRPPNIARSERLNLAQTPIFFSPSEPAGRPAGLHNLSPPENFRASTGPQHCTSDRAAGFSRPRKAETPFSPVSITRLPHPRQSERERGGRRQGQETGADGRGRRQGQESNEILADSRRRDSRLKRSRNHTQK